MNATMPLRLHNFVGLFTVISASGNEMIADLRSMGSETYFWKLPSQFNGNKLGAYGGWVSVCTYTNIYTCIHIIKNGVFYCAPDGTRGSGQPFFKLKT